VRGDGEVGVTETSEPLSLYDLGGSHSAGVTGQELGNARESAVEDML